MHAPLAWATPPPLSADQRQRLDAGEIVLLDALPPAASASAPGGTAVALVCAPPETVWAILVDWPNHPALYPRVTGAEVTQADASRVRVRYTLAIGPLSFEMHLDTHPDAARRRLEWRLAEDQPSRLFSENSGYWQVDELGAGSVVTHAVGTGMRVRAPFTRGSHRDSLVSTIEALRKRAPASPCPTRRP